MKIWLEDNDIDTYSTHNKANLLLLKDLLEPKRIKFANMWLQYQKKVYIDQLDDPVNE